MNQKEVIWLMNLSKGKQKTIVLQLFEVNQLIDEKAFPSAKRIINDLIFDLEELERKDKEWRENYKKM